jgi:transposase-like protein
MSRKIPTPPHDELIELYGRPGSTISSLARHYNTSNPTIRQWLLSYNIDRKSHKQASQEANARPTLGRHKSNSIFSNRDHLFTQRITLRKSKELIAQEHGCSIAIVNKWIKHHNIPLAQYNKSDYTTQLQLDNKELLYDLHVNQKQTCERIAELLGSSKATVSLHLNKHNIPINDSNEYPRHHSFQSKEECEVVDYIRSVYDGPIETNVRGILGSGLELDIYLPEKRLAIEYNGVYSHLYRPHAHSFAAQKGKDYHIGKTKLCEAKGIQLLHIFSSLWKEKKCVWKSLLSYKLGKCPHKVYARKCIIREIDAYTKDRFLEECHLQGADKSTLKLGLFHEDRLISVMTFRPSRFTSEAKWELSRFATQLNTTVVGGFSKLLAFFRMQHAGSIVSYADRTYSSGHVYEANGFSKLRVTAPGFWYVKPGTEKLWHRMCGTKHQLLKRSTHPNPTLTEKELAIELGYNKIFNCGMYVYLLS